MGRKPKEIESHAFNQYDDDDLERTFTCEIYFDNGSEVQGVIEAKLIDEGDGDYSVEYEICDAYKRDRGFDDAFERLEEEIDVADELLDFYADKIEELEQKREAEEAEAEDEEYEDEEIEEVKKQEGAS